MEVWLPLPIAGWSSGSSQGSYGGKTPKNVRTNIIFFNFWFVFIFFDIFISMERYNKQKLENLILEQNKSYSQIGKFYGVSGAAIKKAAKAFGIPLPRRRVINEGENFSHKGFKSTSLVNRLSDEEFLRIINESSTWAQIGEKLGYKKGLSKNVKDSIIFRCSKLGMEPKTKRIEEEVLDKTKGELFEQRKNWQSARSAIQKSARAIYKSFYPKPKCAICGYSNCVEVAHIKAVSEFEDETTIREINSIDNLIGLCPNHHWEYDNGILVL